MSKIEVKQLKASHFIQYANTFSDGLVCLFSQKLPNLNPAITAANITMQNKLV